MEERKETLVDIYKFLSTTHRALMEQRQKYEWKAVYTVLTFYVLAVYANYDKKLNAPNWILIVGLSLLAIFSIIYLICLHKANKDNKEIAQWSEDKLLTIINKKKEFKNQFPCIPLIKRWALIFQIITILLFAIIAVGLIVIK